MREDHVDRFLRELEGLSRDVEPLDLEVEGLVDRIAGISRRIKRALESTLAERGLTHQEWQVLGKLRLSEGHRSSPGDLAAKLELSSGAMTTRLDNLEKAGLVRRAPDPSDRRGVLVELTPEGKDAYDSTVDIQARKEAFFASALTRDELKRLNALLRKLMLAFEDREAASKEAARSESR
ncbi:MAG TPA: MarR family transcriptional regulator [Gaiellaceae bacterium]|nr:MarR family transcriptional regulator [Gaiellaceae bacterium]